MPKIILILFLGLVLRLIGINWDHGGHFHPDERALIMVSDRISFPASLNPNFFNYGSLPLYVLKGTAQLSDFLLKTQLNNYDALLYLGRGISVVLELLTIYLVYKIARKLFENENTALYSSFFYSIAFFPIQNSHFFIVDNFVNFFVTLAIYILIGYKHQRKYLYSLSLAVAAAIASKFTAILLVPFVLGFFLIRKRFKESILYLLLTIIMVFLFMPYAFLNVSQFMSEVMAQTRMNSNAYIFPYTLQYVGTLPYLYYLKNVFLWGLGPIISLLSVCGLFFAFKNEQEKAHKFLVLSSQFSVFLLFYLFYFLVIGRSAVKFMRYLLLMYPFFAVLAGYGFYKLLEWMGGTVGRAPRLAQQVEAKRTSSTGGKENRDRIHPPIGYLIIFAAVIYTFLFINIYFQKHTRIEAGEWIVEHVPKGATLTYEHWDDRLPLSDSQSYKYEEMTLYDQPDDQKKWDLLNEKLQKTDYLILMSNRLYVPLTRLSDCTKYRLCYPQTAIYYKKLFDGELGFRKVAEFTAFPGFKISDLRFKIDDSSADESFTVYDHPKIIIFKRD